MENYLIHGAVFRYLQKDTGLGFSAISSAGVEHFQKALNVLLALSKKVVSEKRFIFLLTAHKNGLLGLTAKQKTT